MYPEKIRLLAVSTGTLFDQIKEAGLVEYCQARGIIVACLNRSEQLFPAVKTMVHNRNVALCRTLVVADDIKAIKSISGLGGVRTVIVSATSNNRRYANFFVASLESLRQLLTAVGGGVAA